MHMPWILAGICYRKYRRNCEIVGKFSREFFECWERLDGNCAWVFSGATGPRRCTQYWRLLGASMEIVCSHFSAPPAPKISPNVGTWLGGVHGGWFGCVPWPCVGRAGFGKSVEQFLLKNVACFLCKVDGGAVVSRSQSVTDSPIFQKFALTAVLSIESANYRVEGLRAEGVVVFFGVQNGLCKH